MNGLNEICVTGLGVVSPVGSGVEAFWQAALHGEVGTRRLTRFDVSSLSSDQGGEVAAAPKSGGADGAIPRSREFALRAARMAVDDAALLAAGVSPGRIGVCVGTVMATRPAIEPWLGGSSDEGDSMGGSWLSPASLSRDIATQLGFGGPNSVISSACASGNSSIAVGCAALQTRAADVMLVAGADELSQAMLFMFDSFKSLAPDAIRPFDRDRRGLLLGEGAAALVLERERDARARGALVHGRVLGCANFADAHHMTAPDPEGRGAIRAMRRALKRAGLGTADIDHISAHGTGTPANDAIEANAVRAVFGADCDGIAVSALKSILGHTQGAAGTIEAVACLLAIRDGVLPPIANHESPDIECNLDLVTGEARATRVNIALSNAFGFGGNIECAVFGAA